MKVTRRGTHAAKSEKPVAKREPKKAASAAAHAFETKHTRHARTLDPSPATHTPVPQRDVHGGDLKAQVEAGHLSALEHAPAGIDLKRGVDIGGGGTYRGFSLTERTAFEHHGKVFVNAVVWETPGRVWFELGPKPPEVKPRPDPAIALRERVDAAKLTPLAKAPKGIEGHGVALGPGGIVNSQVVSGRTAFEVGSKVFIRATIWEQPAPQWFEAK